MRLKLAYFLLPLTLLLSACGLFGGGDVDPDATCYPNSNPVETRSSTTATADPDSPYVPGQLLVRYKAETGIEETGTEETGTLRPLAAQAVQRDYGFRVLEASLGYTDLVALPAGRSVEAELKALNADPRVAYAEPNYYLYPQAVPNDPLIAQQWHLLEFGLPQAWDIETGQSNITIAVLDSGVDLSHEDLRDKVIQGCDFYTEDNDPNPGLPKTTADQTHGTHVAGIAAATGNNGVGVAGVAYAGVKLLPVKVFDDRGVDGDRAAVSAVAKAIRWSAGLKVEDAERNPNRAQIINLSLGGPSTQEDGRIRTLDDAIRDARREGSLTIVASGNDNRAGGAAGDQILAPANAPDALSVGSVDSSYERSTFSMYDTAGPTVDVMAPGGFGTSTCDPRTVVSTIASTAGSGTYGCQAGTSMAAPFVSGVAALIWSQNPDWSANQVEARLLEATRFESFMNESEYGQGVLCADRALGAATLCGN